MTSFPERPKRSLISLGMKTLTLKKKKKIVPIMYSFSPLKVFQKTSKALLFSSVRLQRIFDEQSTLRHLLFIELKSPLEDVFDVTNPVFG